jgi:hypothetical protein
MTLPGKALKATIYAGLFPDPSVRFQAGFWRWNADRIPEHFTEEGGLPCGG